MSRNLSATMATAVTGSDLKPIILIEAQFDSNAPSSYLYLWNGIGNLSWNGYTWIGAGAIMDVSAVEESADLKATGVKVSITGIPSEYISLSFNEDYQGRPLIVRFALLDSSNSVIATPFILFSGRMDVMSIAESGDTSIIEITVENRLIDFERPKVRRYTDQDQKIDHPTDKGLEFVTSIQDKEIIWGRR